MQDATTERGKKLGDDRELTVGTSNAGIRAKNSYGEDKLRAMVRQECSLSSEPKSNDAAWLDEFAFSRMCSSSSMKNSNEGNDAKESESNDESSLRDEVLRMRVRHNVSFETSDRWCAARLAARAEHQSAEAWGVQMLNGASRCGNCRARIRAGRVCGKCRRGVCNECGPDPESFPHDERGMEILCVDCIAKERCRQ